MRPILHLMWLRRTGLPFWSALARLDVSLPPVLLFVHSMGRLEVPVERAGNRLLSCDHGRLGPSCWFSSPYSDYGVTSITGPSKKFRC